MEGQALMYLRYESDDIFIRPISWYGDVHYDVEVSPTGRFLLELDSTQDAGRIKAWTDIFTGGKDQFVFAKTSGFSFETAYIRSIPVVGHAMKYIQNIDHSLNDLRELDLSLIHISEPTRPY